MDPTKAPLTNLEYVILNKIIVVVRPESIERYNTLCKLIYLGIRSLPEKTPTKLKNLVKTANKIENQGINNNFQLFVTALILTLNSYMLYTNYTYYYYTSDITILNSMVYKFNFYYYNTFTSNISSYTCIWVIHLYTVLFCS